MSVYKLLLLLTLITGCATGSKLSKEEKKGHLLLEAGTNSLMGGDYTAALKNLKNAVELIPDSPEAWNNLGLAYYSKGDAKTAKEHFLKALKINGKFSDANNNLGALYLEENQLKSAKEVLEKAAKDLTYDKAHQAYYNLALLSLRQKNLDEAEKYLGKAVEGNHSYCQGWLKLAEISEKKNNTVLAIERLQNASSGLCYGFVDGHYELAQAYVRVRDFESAKIKFEEISKQFPQTAWATQAERNLLLFK